MILFSLLFLFIPFSRALGSAACHWKDARMAEWGRWWAPHRRLDQAVEVIDETVKLMPVGGPTNNMPICKRTLKTKPPFGGLSFGISHPSGIIFLSCFSATDPSIYHTRGDSAAKVGRFSQTTKCFGVFLSMRLHFSSLSYSSRVNDGGGDYEPHSRFAPFPELRSPTRHWMWLWPHLSFQQEVFLTFPNYGVFFNLHLNDLAV